MLAWVTFIILIVCFLAGLTLVLLALWDLRIGTQKRAYFIKGFFGVVLLLIAFSVPALTASMGQGLVQGVGQGSSGQVPVTGSSSSSSNGGGASSSGTGK